MSITVEFPGDHPLTVTGHTLEGYHRPLGGEAASLTVTVDHTEFVPDGLAQPPLGAVCDVCYGVTAVLTGVLNSVRVTDKSVALRIEG